MRGAAGLALGSPAGFMSTGGCEVDDVYDRGCLRIEWYYHRLPTTPTTPTSAMMRIQTARYRSEVIGH
jgi:hypothetical protein